MVEQRTENPRVGGSIPSQATNSSPTESTLRVFGAFAAAFASPFCAADWVWLPGLWHDLGKYRESFQQYLRKAGGASDDGGSEELAPGRVDHSTVGAIHAVDAPGPLGKVAAYPVLWPTISMAAKTGLPERPSSPAAGIIAA